MISFVGMPYFCFASLVSHLILRSCVVACTKRRDERYQVRKHKERIRTRCTMLQSNFVPNLQQKISLSAFVFGILHNTLETLKKMRL